MRKTSERKQLLLKAALQMPQTDRIWRTYNRKSKIITKLLLEKKFDIWSAAYKEYQVQKLVQKEFHQAQVVAAIIIQCHIRGILSRIRVEAIKKMVLFRDSKARVMQVILRYYMWRSKRILSDIYQDVRRERAATIGQAAFRGYVVRGEMKNRARLLLVQLLRTWSRGLVKRILDISGTVLVYSV